MILYLVDWAVLRILEKKLQNLPTTLKFFMANIDQLFNNGSKLGWQMLSNDFLQNKIVEHCEN